MKGLLTLLKTGKPIAQKRFSRYTIIIYIKLASVKIHVFRGLHATAVVMDFVYTEKVISELSRDKILLNYTVDSQMSEQKKISTVFYA
jgi:hypothetical protein